MRITTSGDSCCKNWRISQRKACMKRFNVSQGDVVSHHGKERIRLIWGFLIIRTIGLIRAKVKIALRNLAYNLDRFCVLQGV